MPYLIDGHNVIGQTPGLSLADPDDEVKLVILIRQCCARERRKATVIFDGGLPGGVSNLSTPSVAVIFASDRRATADDLILNRIEAEKNPAGLIVVSSDQKILTAARRRRMPTQSAAEFGRALRRRPATRSEGEKQRGLSEEEVAEWESLFTKKR
jgi:hypothetical protein